MADRRHEAQPLCQSATHGSSRDFFLRCGEEREEIERFLRDKTLKEVTQHHDITSYIRTHRVAGLLLFASYVSHWSIVCTAPFAFDGTLVCDGHVPPATNALFFLTCCLVTLIELLLVSSTEKGGLIMEERWKLVWLLFLTQIAKMDAYGDSTFLAISHDCGSIVFWPSLIAFLIGVVIAQVIPGLFCLYRFVTDGQNPYQAILYLEMNVLVETIDSSGHQSDMCGRPLDTHFEYAQLATDDPLPAAGVAADQYPTAGVPAAEVDEVRLPVSSATSTASAVVSRTAPSNAAGPDSDLARSIRIRNQMFVTATKKWLLWMRFLGEDLIQNLSQAYFLYEKWKQASSANKAFTIASIMCGLVLSLYGPVSARCEHQRQARALEDMIDESIDDACSNLEKALDRIPALTQGSESPLFASHPRYGALKLCCRVCERIRDLEDQSLKDFLMADCRTLDHIKSIAKCLPASVDKALQAWEEFFKEVQEKNDNNKKEPSYVKQGVKQGLRKAGVTQGEAADSGRGQAPVGVNAYWQDVYNRATADGMVRTAFLEYDDEMWWCKHCTKEVRGADLGNHLTSNKHKKNMGYNKRALAGCFHATDETWQAFASQAAAPQNAPPPHYGDPRLYEWDLANEWWRCKMCNKMAYEEHLTSQIHLTYLPYAAQYVPEMRA